MIKLITTIIICLLINNSQSVQKIEGCPRVEGCSLKNYIKSSIYNFIFGNCWDDKSCKGEIETKCCPYSCGHKFCLEPLKPIVRPGQCPLPNGPGACINGCGSDEDCQDPNQKCCSNGCGKVCMNPITVCPIDKSEGFCSIRNNSCNTDNECTSGHKCCPRRCGNKCIKLD